jgi:arsenate reductase
MAEHVYNVLFLCTGNSARSIMAEALVNHWGRGQFCGYSAGSFPTGRVNPLALELLAQMKIPAEGARSKSWDEFAVAGDIEFDFIITVCDKAAGETCPIWPGQPMTAHWGVEDPAAVEGSQAQKMLAFRNAFRALEHRIRIFTNLPLASLDRMRLQHKLDEIGRQQPTADDATAGR